MNVSGDVGAVMGRVAKGEEGTHLSAASTKLPKSSAAIIMKSRLTLKI